MKKKDKISNPNYQIWVTNDGLLTSWLIGSMKEDFLSMVFEEWGYAFDLWTSLEQQLFPIAINKEGNLKIMLMGIKKGSRSIKEY